MRTTQPPFRCYNWSPPLGPVLVLHSKYPFTHKPRRHPFFERPTGTPSSIQATGYRQTRRLSISNEVTPSLTPSTTSQDVYSPPQPHRTHRMPSQLIPAAEHVTRRLRSLSDPIQPHQLPSNPPSLFRDLSSQVSPHRTLLDPSITISATRRHCLTPCIHRVHRNPSEHTTAATASRLPCHPNPSFSDRIPYPITMCRPHRPLFSPLVLAIGVRRHNPCPLDVTSASAYTSVISASQNLFFSIFFLFFQDRHTATPYSALRPHLTHLGPSTDPQAVSHHAGTITAQSAPRTATDPFSECGGNRDDSRITDISTHTAGITLGTLTIAPCRLAAEFFLLERKVHPSPSRGGRKCGMRTHTFLFRTGTLPTARGWPTFWNYLTPTMTTATALLTIPQPQCTLSLHSDDRRNTPTASETTDDHRAASPPPLPI